MTVLDVITEKFIKISRPSLKELLAKEDSTEFKQNLVDDNEEILTKQQIGEIMISIQLGLKFVTKMRASKPASVSFLNDFKNISKIILNNFHSNDNTVIPNSYFYAYAPFTFHYFRCLFGIDPNDYITSFCSSPLRELSNPGASKSIFYLTPDDKFIMKTVQQTEDICLLRMLSSYSTYLTENKESLLPKFSGFYSLQYKSINYKLVSMQNLLPSKIKMHQKFDLKGSTLGREASDHEKSKKSPTFKDLDFNYTFHPKGIFLKPDTRLALLDTIEKDCKILKDFNIMDYSILMGVHYIDRPLNTDDDTSSDANALKLAAIARWESLMADSVLEKSIQAKAWTVKDKNYASLSGSIPAKSVNGDRLLLFVGIIDILQTFRMVKNLEHSLKIFKLKVTPGATENANSISVQPPEYYASRFHTYMTKYVK